jgi:hypothetical protein
MKASPEFIDAIAHLKPCRVSVEAMEAGYSMRDIFTMRPDWCAWAWVKIPYGIWRQFPGIAEDLIRANSKQWVVRCRIGTSRGAYLDEVNLTMADLSGMDLTDAWLTRANLTGANLAGANLTKANLTGANLTKANLTGANLTGANLAGANLAGANLADACLGDANLTGADLPMAYLTGADLTGANLARAYRPEGGIPGWLVGDDGRLVKVMKEVKE